MLVVINDRDSKNSGEKLCTSSKHLASGSLIQDDGLFDPGSFRPNQSEMLLVEVQVPKTPKILLCLIYHLKRPKPNWRSIGIFFKK